MFLSSPDRHAKQAQKQLKTSEWRLVSPVPLQWSKEIEKVMIQRWKFAFLTLLAGGAAWLAPAAKADESNKETVLTFNEPVQIPGQVLAAGTYVFKLVDSQSDRDIVQIFTEDQKHLLATVMAIPDYREEPTGRTVVTFEERPSGSPEALHAWFYPGDTTGVAFVYPKSETQLAAKSEEPPPAAMPLAPPQQAMTEQLAPEPANDEPPAPVIVREQEVIIAQALPVQADNAAPAETDSAPTSLPDTLPQTAGNFASLPLLSVLLLTGGFTTIRFATKRS
jgi:hypothetical protein